VIGVGYGGDGLLREGQVGDLAVVLGDQDIPAGDVCVRLPAEVAGRKLMPMVDCTDGSKRFKRWKFEDERVLSQKTLSVVPVEKPCENRGVVNVLVDTQRSDSIGAGAGAGGEGGCLRGSGRW